MHTDVNRSPGPCPWQTSLLLFLLLLFPTNWALIKTDWPQHKSSWLAQLISWGRHLDGKQFTTIGLFHLSPNSILNIWKQLLNYFLTFLSATLVITCFSNIPHLSRLPGPSPQMRANSSTAHGNNFPGLTWSFRVDVHGREWKGPTQPAWTRPHQNHQVLLHVMVS